MSGLSTLCVPPRDHVWDRYWESVCGSANAKCPGSRVDHNDKVTLYLLLETNAERRIIRKSITLLCESDRQNAQMPHTNDIVSFFSETQMHLRVHVNVMSI